MSSWVLERGVEGVRLLTTESADCEHLETPQEKQDRYDPLEHIFSCI